MSGLARVDRTDLVSNKKVVILISRFGDESGQCSGFEV